MCILISCEGGGETLLDIQTDEMIKTSDAFSVASLPPISDASADHAGRWVAARLSKLLSASHIENEYSASQIDVRRSLHHRQLFGAAASPCGVKPFSAGAKRQLVEQVYLPYRDQVRQQITAHLMRDPLCLHLSVRSFAAKNAKGKYRRTDVGLLYDPGRQDEVDLCLDWIDEMYDEAPNLKVRRNYPGRGTNDSLTRTMRSEFEPMPYLGIEVWVNQAWASRPSLRRDEAIDGVAWALHNITEHVGSKAA